MNTACTLVLIAGALLAQPGLPKPSIPSVKPPSLPTIPTTQPKIDFNTPAEQEVKANLAADAALLAIETESRAVPPHPWAGVYFQGDTTGLNAITIGVAPKAGAAYKWRGSKDNYGSGAGAVKVDNGGGWLTVTYTSQFGMAPDNTVFAPVAWGERHYLIGKGEMLKFCNAVNLGDEPRDKPTGIFFLRPGDENREVKDLPLVPAEFKDRILATPISAKVTKVEALTEAADGRWDSHSYKLTMDKGMNAGLKTGMALSPTDPRAYYDYPITESSADSCIVTFTWSSWQSPDLRKPAAGWTFSTKRVPVPKKTNPENLPK